MVRTLSYLLKLQYPCPIDFSVPTWGGISGDDTVAGPDSTGVSGPGSGVCWNGVAEREGVEGREGGGEKVREYPAASLDRGLCLPLLVLLERELLSLSADLDSSSVRAWAKFDFPDGL